MNASAHWYDRYGQSAHQQPNKTTGGLRPTTITDARKLKLLPSVTTIQQLLAKPQLERWKLEQVAGQAWESFFVREDDRLEKDQFVSTIIEQAFKQVEDAADLGTDIHAAIENHFQGRPYDALMGPYVLRVANWAEQESVEFLEHELRLVSEEHGFAGTTDAVIACPNGRGILDFKGLALDTPIPTPSGWTTMGDVKIGECVFGSTGLPEMVVDKSPVFMRPCFRVTFDDGSTIITDNVHEWAVKIGRKGREKNAIISTQDARAQIGKSIMRVMNSAPLVLRAKALPINPYLLGVWLGDGSVSSAEICVGLEYKKGIVSEFNRYGYKTKETKQGNSIRVSISGGFRSALREIGLLGNKRIPSEYFRSSIDDRLLLLRGLMDTDGHWNTKRKQCYFVSTNPLLRDGVYELVVSLGWRASKHMHVAHGFGTTCDAYTVAFTPFMANPFRNNSRNFPLAQKHLHGTAQSRYRIIKKIEPIATVPTQCITVDTDDSLYLAGSQMVPTHNSRKTKPGQPCTPWETEPMQVAAYFVARFKRLPGEGDCGVNVYVSTTEPGRIEASWYDYHRLCREWHAFEACALLWRHLKQYDPRTTQ